MARAIIHCLILAAGLTWSGAVWAAEPVTLSLTAPAPVERLFLDGGRVLAWLRGGEIHQLTIAGGRAVLVPAASVDRSRWKMPPQGLPDGEVVRNPDANGFIREVWLARPTSRYDHGVLGDAIEAGGMGVLTAERRILGMLLPSDSVFEDRVPRLADLDGDGDMEIITMRSFLDRGAALAVLDVVDNRLVLRATSAPAGLRYRWLNPVGAADFDGDGRVEIAVVLTPHIGGILKLARLDGDRLELREVGRDFSNHAIGSRELGMSAVIDWNGDGIADMAIPDGERRALRIVGLAGGTLSDLTRLDQPAAITSAIIAADLDGDGRQDLAFGLADGSLRMLLSR